MSNAFFRSRNKAPVIRLLFMLSPIAPGGGTQLWVTRHVPPKRPYFFRSFSPKDPHFYRLSPNDPLFFENFDEMLRNFWPFDAFHWKTQYFCALCHWKTPFFDAICHRKTPTSEALGGTRTSLSYVSAPPPGPLRCQCIICPYLSASARCFYTTLAENEVFLVFVDLN